MSERLRYLDKLARLRAELGHNHAKKLNWLKFCHGCGADISTAAPYVRYCGACIDELCEKGRLKKPPRIALEPGNGDDAEVEYNGGDEL